MKIQTKVPLRTSKGENFVENGKPVVLGDVISMMLDITKEKGESRKFRLLSEKFVNSDEVEIDIVDMGLVKKVIENSEYLPTVKGHILLILDEIK